MTLTQVSRILTDLLLRPITEESLDEFDRLEKSWNEIKHTASKRSFEIIEEHMDEFVFRTQP